MRFSCRKYGDPRIVLDLAYNLTYSWHKFSWDADCAVFINMLKGGQMKSVAVQLLFVVLLCLHADQHTSNCNVIWMLTVQSSSAC